MDFETFLNDIDSISNKIDNLVNYYTTSDFSIEFRNIRTLRLIESQKSLKELKRVFLL